MQFLDVLAYEPLRMKQNNRASSIQPAFGQALPMLRHEATALSAEHASIVAQQANLQDEHKAIPSSAASDHHRMLVNGSEKRIGLLQPLEEDDIDVYDPLCLRAGSNLPTLEITNWIDLPAATTKPLRPDLQAAESLVELGLTLPSGQIGQGFETSYERSTPKRERSVKGCQNCKLKRSKCDEIKPICQSLVFSH